MSTTAPTVEELQASLIEMRGELSNAEACVAHFKGELEAAQAHIESLNALIADDDKYAKLEADLAATKAMVQKLVAERETKHAEYMAAMDAIEKENKELVA